MINGAFPGQAEMTRAEYSHVRESGIRWAQGPCVTTSFPLHQHYKIMKEGFPDMEGVCLDVAEGTGSHGHQVVYAREWDCRQVATLHACYSSGETRPYPSYRLHPLWPLYRPRVRHPAFAPPRRDSRNGALRAEQGGGGFCDALPWALALTPSL